MREIVARDLMTPRVLSVGTDWSLRETAGFLVDQEIGAAVVRDDDGKPVGVVSVTDVAAATADESAGVHVDRSRPNYYLRADDERLAPEDL